MNELANLAETVSADITIVTALISMDSYSVVFDTIVEDMPDIIFPDRPLGEEK